MNKIMGVVLAGFIGLLIPAIASLSTMQTVRSELEEYYEKVDKAEDVAQVTGGLMSFVKTKVPIVKRVGSMIPGGNIAGALAEGEETLEDAIALVKKMEMLFYVFLILALFLAFLLFIFFKEFFFVFMGMAFMLGGGLCLINVAAVYYFLVANFDATFKYFYQHYTDMPSQTVMMPFVPGLVKSFSKEFLSEIINMLITRNVITGVLCVLFQVVSLFLHKRSRG